MPSYGKDIYMGWGSGGQLAEEMWEDIKEYIPQENKEKVAEIIYDHFNGYDADNWESCDPDSITMITMRKANECA
jgi:hypothetical protein